MYQKEMNYHILPDNLITLNLGLNVDKFSSNISLKKTSEMRTVAGSGSIIKI